MNYKLLIINLEKRKDRKAEMIKIFNSLNVTDYHFFNAVDGYNVDANHPYLKYFRHDNGSMHRRGIMGCALSHYTIWEELTVDCQYDTYVVLEDDVVLAKDFKNRLDEYIKQINERMDFVFIGMTVEKDNYDSSRNIYQHVQSYSIHPLTRSLFAGGAFGYIITKNGANKLIDYIAIHGISIAIDNILYASYIDAYESHPHLVFTDAVQHSDHFVQSDIQLDYNKVPMDPIENNYIFDDYIFYPTKDSPGGDAMFMYADIKNLKIITDSSNEYVAFNTYGWVKKSIRPVEKFIDLKNKYYLTEGLYVKKSYNPDILLLNAKIQNLQKNLKERPIIVSIGKNSMNYSSKIVQIILSKFPKYYDIGNNNLCELCINHIVDNDHDINPHAINILISGEPWNISQKYDIAIDTKYKSNAIHTIYYPHIFMSIYEHKKSIDPKDYIKNKTKFCAYMYHMRHAHRIKYFDLVSTYKRVDALGRCCNNVEIENTRHIYNENETCNDISVEYYSNYKFVLAIENTIMLDGYTTEKLLNPLLANSLPIYLGDDKIFQYINKKRVVYVPDFKSDDELLEHIKFLDTNDVAYDNIMRENMFVNPDFSLEDYNSEFCDKVAKVLGF